MMQMPLAHLNTVRCGAPRSRQYSGLLPLHWTWFFQEFVSLICNLSNVPTGHSEGIRVDVVLDTRRIDILRRRNLWRSVECAFHGTGTTRQSTFANSWWHDGSPMPDSRSCLDVSLMFCVSQSGVTHSGMSQKETGVGAGLNVGRCPWMPLKTTWTGEPVRQIQLSRTYGA